MWADYTAAFPALGIVKIHLWGTSYKLLIESPLSAVRGGHRPVGP